MAIKQPSTHYAQEAEHISPKPIKRKPSPVRKPSLRPQVLPVMALCGHIGRSQNHTCGAWTCTQLYGGW